MQPTNRQGRGKADLLNLLFRRRAVRPKRGCAERPLEVSGSGISALAWGNIQQNSDGDDSIADDGAANGDDEQSFRSLRVQLLIVLTLQEYTFDEVTLEYARPCVCVGRIDLSIKIQSVTFGHPRFGFLYGLDQAAANGTRQTPFPVCWK